jgi:hypothetical protein
MSTTTKLRPFRTRKLCDESPTRTPDDPRVATGTGLPALAPRTAQPAAYRARSVDRRPRGHAVGRAIGEPPR